MKSLGLAVFLVLGTAAAAEPDFAPKQITNYPFAASPERVSRINANFTKIANGMTPKEVKAVLGEPDEIRPLYDPRIKTQKNRHLIGHTYWYVLRRAQESGSVEEKNESLVRVSFGEVGEVINVDRW